MRNLRKRFVIPLTVLLCLLVGCFVYADDGVSTLERYGKNIIYYDFSKIPDNLVLDRKIELPEDLKEFLNYVINNPRIETPSRFEQEFWEEAHKLDYTLDKLKNASVKEAVMAAVKIVASRFTFCYVDKDEVFIKEFGAHLSKDVYFHLGLGDCDKYREATIAVFKIIKRLNPKLQNVYLSTQRLGGNVRGHAWVSVVILQDSRLILSHIDPTYYDNGSKLEADEYHICLEHNIFIAYFYKALPGCDNYIYAYQILEQAFLKVKVENKERREMILDDMSLLALRISVHKPEATPDRVLWTMEQYEAERFTKNLDAILYRVYLVYSNAGNKLEAEKYRQRLLKEFPNSSHAGWIK